MRHFLKRCTGCAAWLLIVALVLFIGKLIKGAPFDHTW
jgi:hypothetical protein